MTTVSRLVIIKILAVSDVGIAHPIAGSVDMDDRALARDIPQGSSLCTWIRRAAVVSGNQLIMQRGSATITLGGMEQTFVPTFVIGSCVVTLIFVDHRLVPRLG